mmetsp:Transcript_25215/g.25428  ORF Transcript_25215/g.25428 Transcript_25215/m.25428 type:complete len:187 (+) Transcript_25215:335-895(+)
MAAVYVGCLSPNFSLLDGSTGNIIQLSQFRGRKVWIAFFRFATCPFCIIRLREMIEKYGNNYEIQILVIFQSPVEHMKKTICQLKSPFPLLSDSKQAIYKIYHVQTSYLSYFLYSWSCCWIRSAYSYPNTLPKVEPQGDLGRLPSDFLIDETGKIKDIFRAKHIHQHIPFHRVDHFICPKDAFVGI